MAGPIAFTQVRYKLANDDGPFKYMRLEPGSTQVTIPGVERLNTYIVEARNVGPTGLVSRWVDLQQTVASAESPHTPYALTVGKLVNGALLRWQMPPGTPSSTVYEVHRAPNVNAANPLVPGTPGTWAEVGTTGSLSYTDYIETNGVYWYRVNAKNRFDDASDGFSNEVAVDLLTEAELEANLRAAMQEEFNKVSFSDGAVNTFWQNDPPPIGDGPDEARIGDIWFDTNNADTVWRVREGVWKLSPNDALAEAIKAAVNAQSTADGKVKMHRGPNPPVGNQHGINDLWFNTTTGTLLRWNGANWNEKVSDITLDQIGGRGINLLPDEYSTFQSTALPPSLQPGNGTLSRSQYTIVPGSAGLAISQTAGNEAYVYFGPYNIPHAAGRKYLVSAYFGSNSAPRNIQLYAQMSASGAHVNAGVKTRPNQGPIENSRITWLLDLSAQAAQSFRIRFDNEGSVGDVLIIDGIMVEELVGNKIEASAYSRGMATNMSINALLAAQDAKATADGKIDIYRTNNPPPIGGTLGAQFGDYWQDSDNGRWHYCNGSSWVETPDSRLPQLVVDLQNTNLTVSAKTRLFFQEAQPTATANGDLWYKPSTKITYYWNGGGWSLLTNDPVANADTLVLNPAFEQGFEHWYVQSGWYTEASSNAAFNGTGAVRAGNPSVPHARIHNHRAIAVSPGQRLFISGKLRNLFKSANGQCYIGFLFYDGAGGGLGERLVQWTEGNALASTEWRQTAKKITVPNGATHAHVTAVCYNHTVGYWCVDEIRCSHVDDVTEAPVSGENMIPNGNFSQNTGGWPTQIGVVQNNQMLTDGWRVAEASGVAGTSGLIQAGLETGSHDAGARQLFVGDMGGVLPPGNSNLYVHSTQRFSVAGNERFVIDFRGQVDRANVPPPGTRYYVYVGLWCFNKDGVRHAYAGWNSLSHVGGFGGSHEVAIPAGTVEVEAIVGVSWQNLNGYNVNMPWAVCHCRFQQVKVRRVVTLDERVIDNGGVYGKIANWDLHDYDGRRRLGLRIPGSRHILGGARNIRAAQVMGFNAVRTNGSLTATSTGTISINAHSVELGGETVTYTAVPNAIVGLAQGVTYVVYTLDPYMDGGARTYYAQTTILSAAQAGNGAIYMGQVTIPTSGSSGGGGGGDREPWDWCVDADMLLPDGRRAADIKAGDLIPCWNEDADEPDIEWVEVESNTLVADQPSTCIETLDGAMVIASNSTPMTLRDGRTVRMPEMFGEDALVSRKGQTPYWSQVVKCVPLGQRTVAKIKVHQRCYFAGVTTDLTIATHNPTMKP